MSKKLSLDQHLARAKRQGNQRFIDYISELRWELYSAHWDYDWVTYNRVAHLLNKYGSTIPDHKIVQEFPKENAQMGMFDTPMYLTGKEDAFVQPGDTFWLHNAKPNGTVRIGTETKEQVKLLVSHHEGDTPVVVLSAGAAIVRQVKAMDNQDRSRLPMEVRLDQLPSKQGSPTNVITPANEPAPDGFPTPSNPVADF